MSERPLTGRKVFLIVASAFGVIIGVNMTLAYMAVSTFPGLEARNGFVASQTFEAQRAAQLALGWTVEARLEGDEVVLSVTDSAGRPVRPELVQATLGRATHVNADRAPDFTFDGAAFRAPAVLEPGNWNLRLVARAADGTEFRQRIVIYKRSGA